MRLSRSNSKTYKDGAYLSVWLLVSMEIRASFSLVSFARDLAQYAGKFQLISYEADARLYD